MKTMYSLVLVLVAGLVGLGVFAGCATTGAQAQTPAQIAAVVCPQLSVAGSQLSAFNAVLIANPATAAVGTKANADLAKLTPIVNAVCAAGATVTADSLNALVQQALPAFGAIVGSLPLPPAQQAQIQGALVLAETAAGVAGVVEAQIAAAKASPVSASTAAK